MFGFAVKILPETGVGREPRVGSLGRPAQTRTLLLFARRITADVLLRDDRAAGPDLLREGQLVEPAVIRSVQPKRAEITQKLSHLPALKVDLKGMVGFRLGPSVAPTIGRRKRAARAVFAVRSPGAVVMSEKECPSSSVPLHESASADPDYSRQSGQHQSHEVRIDRAKPVGLVVAIAACILYMVKSYGYGLGSPASLGVGMMPLASGAAILVGLITLLVRVVFSTGPRKHAHEDHGATVASPSAGYTAAAVQVKLRTEATTWDRGAQSAPLDDRRRPWCMVMGLVRFRLPTIDILDGSSIGSKLLRILLLLAGALPLLLVSESLGFFLSSIILVVVAMIGMGERRVIVLLVSGALVPMAEYLLFHTAFRLPLP